MTLNNIPICGVVNVCAIQNSVQKDNEKKIGTFFRRNEMEIVHGTRKKIYNTLNALLLKSKFVCFYQNKNKSVHEI